MKRFFWQDKKFLKIKLSEFLALFISDKKCIELQYKIKTGEKLDFSNPVTYNEKIQWLKLNYRDPLLKKVVDKYEVREYVKETIGEKYLIPLIGLYNNVHEIDFDALPQKFIMKMTNGSSFNYISRHKTAEDIKNIKRLFSRWQKTNFYTFGREWAYKDVPNRIICEELLQTSGNTEPDDFRIFCFNGKAEFIVVDYDTITDGVKSTKNKKRNIYDKDINLTDYTMGYPNAPHINLEKTPALKEMIMLAEKLSKPFPVVRVDFYHFDNKTFFGELTFYHGSGYLKMDERFARRMGKLTDLQQMKGGEV